MSKLPPPKPLHPSPLTASETWAEVHAHDRVTRYRRSGAGRAVVVLLAAEAAPLWPGLGRTLAPRCRVITPELPSPGTDVVDWLGEFLEGLGVSDVGLVAAGHLCVPAFELTFGDVDQIARLVLVPDGDGDGPGGGPTYVENDVAHAAGSPALPLLVVGRAVPDEQALLVVERFLLGEDTTDLGHSTC
jgi:hypothetical protein